MRYKRQPLKAQTAWIHRRRPSPDERAPAEKRLEIVVRRAGDRSIAITVRDNGIGIAPENLTRIFGHGFTTKRDGHGFGLHSGALAAKQMNGSLSVHSDGPGQGNGWR